MIFNVGDRVRVIKSYDALHEVVGTEGVVCQSDYDPVGVWHDMTASRMHNCNHHCPEHHGWYYLNADKYLEKIDAELPRIDTLDDLV